VSANDPVQWLGDNRRGGGRKHDATLNHRTRSDLSSIQTDFYEKDGVRSCYQEVGSASRSSHPGAA